MRTAIRLLLAAAGLVVLICTCGCGSKNTPSKASGKTSDAATRHSGSVDSGAKKAAEAKPAPKAEAPRPDANELLKNLQTTYRKMASLKVETSSETIITADGKPVGKPVLEKASLLFKRPNKLLVKTPQTGMIVDGKTVYNYSTAAKQYIESPFAPAFVKSLTTGKPGVGLFGLLFGTDYSKAIVSPRMLPDAKIGAHDVYVLTFGLKPGAGVPKGVTGTETLWIGKKDMGLYRNRQTIVIDTRKLPAKAKNPAGKTAKVLTTTTTNDQTLFKPNVRIPDSTFIYKPPAGTKQFEQPKPMALMNKAAPDFSFVASDGTSRKLSELRGKFVLLNFWGLPMCETQLPVLQGLSQSLPPDAELVALNLNPNKQAVLDYLTKKNNTFPVVFADANTAKVVGEHYNLVTLPTTLIVDKNGVVRAQFMGLATQKQIEDRLNSLR